MKLRAPAALVVPSPLLTPRAQSTRRALSAATSPGTSGTLVVLKSTRRQAPSLLQLASLQVRMLRAAWPRLRSRCAAPPRSTSGPSGASEYGDPVPVLQAEASEPGIDCQKLPLSAVQ